MNQITGNMNAMQQGDFVSLPTDAEGYLTAARGMLDGARVLCATPAPPIFALCLLCGFCAEAALKAMLSQTGVPTDKLAWELGHRLIDLWSLAVAKGIPLEASPSDWIKQLHGLHNAPYQGRYPLGINMMAFPNAADMLKGCEDLCSLATT